MKKGKRSGCGIRQRESGNTPSDTELAFVADNPFDEVMDGDPGWIVTATGARFYPLAPRREDIHIDDIAAALSKVCRFTGHCSRFYSVAQHSVYTSKLVQYLVEAAEQQELWQFKWSLALRGLLHDASEAYLSDIAAPVKRLSAFAGYRQAERDLAIAIYEAYGCADIHGAHLVRYVDQRIVTNEAIALMPTIPDGWTVHPAFTALELQRAGIDNPFEAWSPERAEQEFLGCFEKCIGFLPEVEDR